MQILSLLNLNMLNEYIVRFETSEDFTVIIIHLHRNVYRLLTILDLWAPELVGACHRIDARSTIR